VNPRLVLAMIVAPVAAALAYGSLLYWQFQEMQPKPENAAFFFPGFLAGLLFEVFALLPLLLVLRRVPKGRPILFAVVGFLLWALFIFAFNAMVMPLEYVLRAMVPMLPPGVALLLVFGAAMYWRADA